MNEQESKTFYPELCEGGEDVAQKLMDSFKNKLKGVAEEVINDFYYDIPMYVEADSWTNFKQSIVNGLSDYRNKKLYPYDFARIRRAIYDESKDEIIKDLNQDLLKQIEDLKIQVKNAYESNRY